MSQSEFLEIVHAVEKINYRHYNVKDYTQQ